MNESTVFSLFYCLHTSSICVYAFSVTSRIVTILISAALRGAALTRDEALIGRRR